MIKIKATVEDKKQVEKISKDIIQYLKETYFNIIADIYKQIFKKDIKYNEIEENDLFFQAVRNNKITIHNNKIKGKFNSKLTKYIREKLKGKWNNKTKSYTVDKLPYNVKQYINKQKEKIQLFNDKIQEFLNDYSYNINQSIEQAPIDYNNIITDIKEQIQDNLKDFIVKPEINENIQQEINENYINNSKLSIKNWQESNISKLRQEMQEQVLNGGYSNQSIAEFIQNNYGTTQKKAIFLARNEAKLINGEYSKQQYLENGITKYIWQTSKDERVREDHKVLDGKIFDFRDPPIIDSKTGKRGNPQEDYGCRCVANPIIDWK